MSEWVNTSRRTLGNPWHVRSVQVTRKSLFENGQESVF
jgi:hypothetical protein